GALEWSGRSLQCTHPLANRPRTHASPGGTAMAALLALSAAVAYGVGDFLGGVAARRVPPSAVELWSHVVGLVMLVGAAPLVAGEPSGRALTVGAAAGLLGGTGVA